MTRDRAHLGPTPVDAVSWWGLVAGLAATGASEPRWHRMRRRLPDVLRPRADMLYRPEVGACLGELLAGLCPERSNSEEAR